MQKVLSHQVQCLVLRGGERRFASVSRRLWCVSVKQGGTVAGGLIVEGFVGKENFEMDALGDGEPMESVKCGN